MIPLVHQTQSDIDKQRELRWIISRYKGDSTVCPAYGFGCDARYLHCPFIAHTHTGEALTSERQEWLETMSFDRGRMYFEVVAKGQYKEAWKRLVAERVYAFDASDKTGCNPVTKVSTRYRELYRTWSEVPDKARVEAVYAFAEACIRHFRRLCREDRDEQTEVEAFYDALMQVVEERSDVKIYWNYQKGSLIRIKGLEWCPRTQQARLPIVTKRVRKPQGLAAFTDEEVERAVINTLLNPDPDADADFYEAIKLRFKLNRLFKKDVVRLDKLSQDMRQVLPL